MDAEGGRNVSGHLWGLPGAGQRGCVAGFLWQAREDLLSLRRSSFQRSILTHLGRGRTAIYKDLSCARPT